MNSLFKKSSIHDDHLKNGIFNLTAFLYNIIESIVQIVYI